MTKRAIIVDDEPLGIERIRIFLEKEDDFLISKECSNGKSAVTAIQQIQPDVVFLDIQMPDLDGFGVVDKLQALQVPPPNIIFVTAYNEYALKAFEINAVDYLLKPVQHDRFKETLERVRARVLQNDTNRWEPKWQSIIQQMRPKSYLKRVEIRSEKRTDYVKVEDIYWLKADGNYIEVYCKAKTHLARITLAELETQLDPASFLRISRSALVNLNYVKSIQSTDRRNSELVLTNDCKIPITRAMEILQDRLKF